MVALSDSGKVVTRASDVRVHINTKNDGQHIGIEVTDGQTRIERTIPPPASLEQAISAVRQQLDIVQRMLDASRGAR